MLDHVFTPTDKGRTEVDNYKQISDSGFYQNKKKESGYQYSYEGKIHTKNQRSAN